MRSLPGADSVLLNWDGSTYSLIGSVPGAGKRKLVSLAIPKEWMEDPAMILCVLQAVSEFSTRLNGSLPSGGLNKPRPRETFPPDFQHQDR